MKRPILSKRCPKCGKTKLLSAFHRNKTSKLGVSCWCKECKSASNKLQRLTRVSPEHPQTSFNCPSCSQKKPGKDFYRNRARKTGIAKICKECDTEQRRRRQRSYKSIVKEKLCPRCGKVKMAVEFYTHAGMKSGLQTYCKGCTSDYMRERRVKSGLPVMEKLPRGQRRCGQCKKVLSENNFYHRSDGRYYRSWCKTCEADMHREFKENNPEWMKEWYRFKRKTDIRYALSNYFSRYISWSLRRNKRQRHWEKIVGYTLLDLMDHLERNFEPDMTWDNYGSEWHIDHIIPLSSFSFSSYQDVAFKEAWRLMNLMPRWATTKIARLHGSNQIGNINKGASILLNNNNHHD